MEQKRPIDLKRERSGHFDVGNEEDGAIKQMLNISDKLLVIKERAIYEVIFADTIDPGRENADLPVTIQKKLLALGTESELVSRTYLMVLNMFKKEYLLDIPGMLTT